MNFRNHEKGKKKEKKERSNSKPLEGRKTSPEGYMINIVETEGGNKMEVRYFLSFYDFREEKLDDGLRGQEMKNKNSPIKNITKKMSNLSKKSDK
jgi:hypothetical protein